MQRPSTSITIVIIRSKLNPVILSVVTIVLFSSALTLADETADGSADTTAVDSTDAVKQTFKSPRKAMALSVVFPGMGQLYNGKKFKAFIVFCAEVGLLSNSIYLNQKYKNQNKLPRLPHT